MSSKRFIKTLYVVASLLLLGTPAYARTIHASSGSPSMMGTEEGVTGWRVSDTVAYTPLDLNRLGYFYVPIDFDNPGARDIIVRGKVDAGEGLLCMAIAYKTDGSVASASTRLALAATGVFTFRTLRLSSVPVGATGAVHCLFSKNAELLNIDYLP
jgi:hypothetical protein